MTVSGQETAAAANAAEAKLVAAARRELDQSCAALDGATLSRLNSIRHSVLEQKPLRSPRTLLLPFGGLVTACLLAVTVAMLLPEPTMAPDGQASGTPLEDIELLTDAESFELYEDYEFYQWLAESGRTI
jgi:hypothetical protein